MNTFLSKTKDFICKNLHPKVEKEHQVGRDSVIPSLDHILGQSMNAD